MDKDLGFRFFPLADFHPKLLATLSKWPGDAEFTFQQTLKPGQLGQDPRMPGPTGAVSAPPFPQEELKTFSRDPE